MADHILAPEAMPAVLGQYFRNQYIAEPNGGETSKCPVSGTVRHMRRMLPYRTLDNRIAGVVITFFDVTEARAARQASTEARIFAQAIVETISQPFLVMDDALNVVSINPAFETLFRVSGAAEVGLPVFELAQGGWNLPQLRELIDVLVRDGQPFNNARLDQIFPVIGLRHLLINGRKLLRDGGRQSLILLAIGDVTERRRAEAVSRQLAAIVDSSRDAIISIYADGLIDSWNPGAETIFGFAAAGMMGKPLSGMNDPAQPRCAGCLSRAVAHAGPGA